MSLQRHRDDVVQLEIIGQGDDRAVRGLHIDRLVIDHPIAEIFDPSLAQMIERGEILGQARAEPAARPRPGKFLDDVEGAENRIALVGELMHRLLIVAMRVELPAAVEARLDSGWELNAHSYDQ